MEVKGDVPSPTIDEAWEEVLTRWETHIEDVIVRYLDRQRSVIISRLLGVKTRRAVLERGRPLEVKAIVDEIRWRQELTTDLTSAFNTIYQSVGAGVLKQIDPSQQFDPNTSMIVADISSLVRNATATGFFEARITSRLTKERDRIQRKADLEDLAARLTEEYSAGARNFARRLAQSTAPGAVNGASFAAASQSPLTRTKSWVNIGDTKVRTSHGLVDPRPIANDNLFVLGSGSQARFPNDPTLPTKDWINCRCSVVYAVAEVGSDPIDVAGETLAALLGL